MEKNAANGINYLARIGNHDVESLAVLRKWEHLKMGSDGENYWLKGFHYAEIHSAFVRGIPFLDRFEEREGKLYRLNNLLPYASAPDVLWSDITRGIPVRLPSLNHNYFGVQEQVPFRLIPSTHEQPVCAQLIDSVLFREYIETAAQVRMETLDWTLYGNAQVLIMGEPLLPLPGPVFWKYGRHLLPAGQEFELSAFAHQLYRQLCPDGTAYLFWQKEQPELLPLFAFESLSRSSVRRTFTTQLSTLNE